MAKDFISGACLGALISTIFFPLNVIKTRAQCQLGGRMESAWTVAQTVYRERGSVAALFKGMHLNYTRSFISWGIINTSYEFLMRTFFTSENNVRSNKPSTQKWDFVQERNGQLISFFYYLGLNNLSNYTLIIYFSSHLLNQLYRFYFVLQSLETKTPLPVALLLIIFSWILKFQIWLFLNLLVLLNIFMWPSSSSNRAGLSLITIQLQWCASTCLQGCYKINSCLK